VGDPNNLVVRVHRGLRLVGETFYLNQGYDWVNPKDTQDLRVRSCGVIAGTWLVSTKELPPMVVTQAGCDFRAAFWNGDFTIFHEISGKVGVNERMTVVRRAPGCTTEMYGNVFLGGSGLWWTIDGTSGGCGLSGHRETRMFEREASYEQAMARTRIPPILIDGLKNVIIRNYVDYFGNRGDVGNGGGASGGGDQGPLDGGGRGWPGSNMMR
jgi:hypothetical protein